MGGEGPRAADARQVLALRPGRADRGGDPEVQRRTRAGQEGKPITITGKLTHADPTSKSFAGRTVHYYFRPAGSTHYVSSSCVDDVVLTP
ncbi:hypothetical protein ACIA8F_37185 [Streptomyces sp. NPDC051563]|uniref:hypothetical protein n=1 Tax=Streptomyces sp. NPDC051563 TaxID=3365659 RepID=UPI0037A8B9F8